MTIERSILVTGAAGRLGGHVVRLLAREGWSITGLARHDDDLEPVRGLLARVVRGNVTDPRVADDATCGVSAVVHLAAIPAPALGADHEVFGNNTVATYVVLDAAARAGAGCAVVASSFAASGLPFAPVPLRPPYLPLDEDAPTQAADPYALSKTTDEATAAMMSRRYGITTTALRLPFLGTPEDRLGEHARELAQDPALGVRDLWTYLDSRYAARAVGLALRRSGGDSVVLNVAAPQTLVPYPTEQLLTAFLPDVPRRAPLPGRTAPLDVGRAARVLGFTIEHPWELPTRDLPVTALPAHGPSGEDSA